MAPGLQRGRAGLLPSRLALAPTPPHSPKGPATFSVAQNQDLANDASDARSNFRGPEHSAGDLRVVLFQVRAWELAQGTRPGRGAGGVGPARSSLSAHL